MIIITATRDIGPLLRRLRVATGLSIRDIAARAHVSKSGIAKREKHPGMNTAALIAHLDALGYDLVIVERRGTTGGEKWPAP